MTAPTPCEALWASYLAAEDANNRRTALRLLGELVELLRALPERERSEWAADFCRRVLDEGQPGPVRHPLLVGILVPFLKVELARNELPAARWLASLAQHLYANRAAWQEFDFLTEHEFLERALSHDAEDGRSKLRLFQVIWDELRYATHEVPWGVLYGTNGASRDECVLLLNDVARLKDLATTELPDDRRAQLDKWRLQIEAYRDHLEAHAEPSYQALLEKRGLI